MAKSHSRWGPSTLDALSKCVRFKYSDIDNDAAEEGTMLHEAVETGSVLGLDEEQRSSVNKIREYIESLKEGKPEDWHELHECRIRLEDLTYGTADVVLIHKREPRAHVGDAKFTRIEGEHAFQVRTYGAGLVETITQARNIMDHDGNVVLYAKDFPRGGIKEVTLHVIAPRTNTITQETHIAQKLLSQVRADIEDLYEKIDDPWRPPTPSDTLCGKCARASTCPALNKVAVQAAKGVGLPLPEQFSPDAIVSVEDRARAQVIASALSNWADQIKKMNNEYAKEGGEIPGFKLRSRSTGLRLPKEYTSIAIGMLADAGIPESTVMEAMSITLGKLAQLHSDNTGATKAEVKELIQTTLADYVEEGQTQFLQKAKRVSDDKLMEQINNGSVA